MMPWPHFSPPKITPTDEHFLPQLAKIDEVEQSVAELERTVGMLDNFTRGLEEKYVKVAQQRREATRLAAKAGDQK
jgi:hypothetical protein